MEQKGQKMLGWFRKKPNEKLYAERIYEALADGDTISWLLCSRIIGCGNTRPLGTLSIQLNENDEDHSRIVG